MNSGLPRILLVDDRSDNLLALRAVLEPLPVDLVCAGSGRDALVELLDGDFAVVVLDVQMPDMDGFETARLIKGRERTRLLPIIFLTAISGEPQHLSAGYQAGAVDYIKKPFDPDTLRAKVQVFAELWRRGRLIDEQRAALADQVAAIDRLNADLESSNAVLHSFASRAAEDLLEPLDALVGYLEVLGHRQVLAGDGPAVVERATALANRQRDRVLALLQYAEAGSPAVSVEDVDLRAGIEEAGARAGLSVDGAAVTIVGETSTVPGDRRQLVRLLELLIVRAVDQAGALTVSVGVTRERGAAIVRVGDDGKTPSAEDSVAMFADPPAEVIDDPARVGLLVARRIVERHGGTIWAEAANPGTIVTFTLPDRSRG